MALNIGLEREGIRPFELERENRIDLEDDGYYWFLFPHFEDLANETGQMIDLYNGAVFESATLAAFRAMIERAKGAVRTMPDCWNVQTGSEIGSYLEPKEPTPVFSAVEKGALIQLLDRFAELVDTAISTKGRIRCLGD